MSERKSIIYFSKPGEGDADETMKAAYERAKELGIRDIVVASTRGATALKALEVGELEERVRALEDVTRSRMRTVRGRR